MLPETKRRVRSALRIVLAVAMTAIGVAHFVAPAPFEAIVPAYLPAPHALVLVSGFFEVAGGLGLLVPRVRSLAGYGLIALYLAVFPANLNMALNQIQIGEAPLSPAFLWGRLPFQILFIAWAYWVSRPDGDADSLAKASAPRI